MSNTINKINISNIILISIISIILIVPITEINKREILPLYAENRNASRYNGLKVINNDTKNTINYNYGGDFNRWFGDRFRGREEFIKTNNILYNNFHLKSRFLKDNWVGNIIPNKLTLFTEQELENYKNHIIKFDNWCKEKKIKCYVVNMPQRDKFFREYIGYSNDLLEKSNIGKQLNEYLKNNGVDFQIIDLHEKMFDLMHKGEILFWKTDGHQTNTTSFLIYKEILNAIKKDFTDFKMPKDEDFEITYEKSAIDKRYCERNNYFFCPTNSYKTIRYNKANNYVSVKNSFTGYTEKDGITQPELQQTTYQDGNPQTILYLGRSYSNRVNPYMSYSFQNFYWKGIWHNTMAQNYCEGIAEKWDFERGCFSQQHIDGILNEFNIKPDIIVLLDNDLEYTQDF
ncbi:MAG: hypothetical protein Ta2D_06910 [Rickettsiales bacterium]|nr:MAG: hypothetical protein Ta2D_06910 [Rickettsiales bacterium]